MYHFIAYKILYLTVQHILFLKQVQQFIQGHF